MRTALLTAALTLLAIPALAQANTACGNGDFESGLDASEWSGGHGFVLRNGEPHFASFESGFFPGDLHEASAHQTVVDDIELDRVTGIRRVVLDPVTGIRRVAPGGSTRAVRIGNSFCEAHADMLAKTFVVGAAQSVIRFSYAVVLQHGGHRDGVPSSFRVRVLDAARNPIAGVANLVDGRDELVAGDSSVLQRTNDVSYRPWTRGTIDLSRYVGQTVTVQFITEDCSGGGHYAYAYVDDFCGTCGGTLDPVTPTIDCGAGEVCVRYELPEVAGVTGNVVLRLDVVRDGVVLTSISSPAQTTGTSYCFTFDPAVLAPYVNRELRFAVTGTFSAGGSLCEVKTVDIPGGPCPPPVCGTGVNAIDNGDFEEPVPAPPVVLPGQEAVLNAAQAAAIAHTWQTREVEGQFLLVNGATGRGGKRMVWSQKVPVLAERDYLFCANFRSLPAICFDVAPEVEVRFSTGDTMSFGIETDPRDRHLESRLIHIPADVTMLTCEIWLDESASGDGNDLAIDDIGLHLSRQ